MKYMTFHSSCAYAGLANMLSFCGVDTTDRQIALEMKLPYLFAYEDGSYLAGTSLQSARWFDLYLNPLGFALREQSLPRETTMDFLRRQPYAMLGIHMENGGKHAVVYTGSKAGKLHFLNNKWQQEPGPETLLLTEAELLSRLDDTCTVATLESISPKAAPVRERMEASLSILAQYCQALGEICTQPRPTAQLRDMLNPVFRALLLDGITMLELLGEHNLHAQLTALQRILLTTLHSDQPEIRLADHLSMDTLVSAVEAYTGLIRTALND